MRISCVSTVNFLICVARNLAHCMLHKSYISVWSVITTKKWHGRPVDTTAKEGDSVSFGRPLGTTKEAMYVVSQGDL